MKVKVKVFEANNSPDVETALNTFLLTLTVENVLSVDTTAFGSGQYGNTRSYVAVVVYKG